LALIAQSFLGADVRKRVNALLAADTDYLTAHDIASAATWADKLRDANTGGARQKTRQWHFVDIEIAAPDLDAACFNHPPIPSGTVASDGPAADCVVDKIEEFAAELANPTTDAEEQVVALKFLLHFVGDLHQPLHSSDDNDRGATTRKSPPTASRLAIFTTIGTRNSLLCLRPNAKSIASDLIGHISKDQEKAWQAGSPSDWAKESFLTAKTDAYGLLGEPSSRGSYRLTDGYVTTATDDVARQLSKAGVRLAFVLNKVLGRQ